MKNIHLSVHGFGILMYSPFAAQRISLNQNFLEESFATPKQVLPFVQEGSLVAFQTGDGFFHLRLRKGYPDDKLSHMLRLAVEVRDETLCFRDLYDCYQWSPDCPSEQQVALGNGFYHVTLCSDGNFAQNEVTIFVYINQLDHMPLLDFRESLPVLFG